MAEQTFDVHVEREFDAPIERVWAAWTTPDDLRAWWGPTGFSCPRAEVDIREGGSIFVTMRAPDEWGGGEYHSVWEITELDEPVLLRYIYRFTDADRNVITPAESGVPAEGIPDEAHHEVLLTAVGDGRTRLEMTEHGYTNEQTRDMSRSGLDQCLDKMAEVVSAQPR
ncbi:SRPBCC domain-containing protein [Microbacterium pumilum]|uniref:SRPBCC domain-containing protein n=1 Tax=Microbacterium pumilum TaxID=344165 RepID=A0ABN2S968_9MICO